MQKSDAPQPAERSVAVRLVRMCLPGAGSPLRLAFDIAFGIVAPPMLFHLDLEWDPMRMGGINLLPLRPYSVLLAFGAMACLAVWLPSRRRSAWLGAFLAGPLLGAALMALCIGLWFLPFTVLGTFFMGLGLLGLVPFVTAMVYLDAGLEALEAGRARLGRSPALAAAGCAGLLLASLAAGSGRIVKGVESREIAVLTGQAPGDAERAVRRLQVLRRFPGIRLRQLEIAVRRADGPEGIRLGRVYRDITGHSVPEMD
ncbi:MAG TPA: hypothetical protein VFS92_03625 [Planctomycetota bacterium]|nr:hypothetical protein [Planctomycetota bacterium]